MKRDDLERLSKNELIELVLRLQRPAKDSRTSSQPPSLDRKARRENAKPGGAKPGHAGHKRELCEAPDNVVEHRPSRCERCGLAFTNEAEAELIGEWEAIELPLIRPIVTRHRRFQCRCACSRRPTRAAVPDNAQATPFGPRIHAMAVYLKTTQLFSYRRLAQAFADLFGLTLSEGALMTMFRRTQAAFTQRKAAALAQLRQARMVHCDETGVRIEALNGYHWVFGCETAIVHEAALSRAGSVIDAVMAGHRPAVWLSDRYTAQQNQADRQQTCLAHLDRKARFADENGTDDIPARLRWWFNRAFTLGRTITTLAAGTVKARRRALERDLAAILTTPTSCDLARDLLAQISRARQQLLTFIDFPGLVEPTNNASERALRPSVIQRKVTNGYRAAWAADYEAAIRTTIDTARLAGAGTFQTILDTITA